LAMMKLVVGLGNLGSKYQGTRHNIGFELVDQLARGGTRTNFGHKFDGQLAEIEIDYRRVLLLKPETFMNLSGRSVGQVARFYKLEPQDILAVCDDLNLPVGKLRIRPGGSDGGQKGLRDSAAHLGTDQYPRLRIGIGDHGEVDASDYVLSRFRNQERALIDDSLILATQAVAVWVTQGIEKAMDRFNGPTANT
jgi:peptidyl-tRNA hydrolase, PTH1 family